MGELRVGYARCSTDAQDLTAQRDALIGVGVEAERIYVDHGLTETTGTGPVCAKRSPRSAGDVLVVTELDRLARSVPDARAIADELTHRKVKLSIGGSVYDPTDPSESCCSPWRSPPKRYETRVACILPRRWRLPSYITVRHHSGPHEP